MGNKIVRIRHRLLHNNWMGNNRRGLTDSFCEFQLCAGKSRVILRHVFQRLLFWGWWSVRVLVDTLVFSSLLLCICPPNPWVLFPGVGACCWMSSLATRTPGVFGGQALSWSNFPVVVSSTSCCCTVYVVQG